MANRVLVGDRTTGGYGLYVSRLTSNVLDCANDKLMFNTNSGETGSNFFSAGHFQLVPVSGGTGSSAPVTTSTTTVSANSTAIFLTACVCLRISSKVCSSLLYFFNNMTNGNWFSASNVNDFPLSLRTIEGCKH